MAREDATPRGSLAVTRGIVGEPDTIYVYDRFYEASPPVVMASHTPDTDLEGGGWVACRWAGAFRCIAGSKADAADWPNHGANVIDIGVGSDFQLICNMTFKGPGNYVGFVIGAAGTGVADFAGWQIAYFPTTNTWRMSDSYWGGGGAGTIASAVQAMDETGATEYEIKIVKDGSAITVYIDDVQLMTATNNKYDANTHHGLYAWSDNGATWSEFYLTSLPGPERTDVSADRSDHGLWFEDQFTEGSYPTVISAATPDFDWTGYGWEEFGYSGTVDQWQVINYQNGSLRCVYSIQDERYLLTDQGIADGVIRAAVQDHQGVNPMWDALMFRYVDMLHHWRIQLNAESNWVILYKAEGSYWGTQADRIDQTVDPSDRMNLVLTLDGNSISCQVQNVTQGWSGTLSTSDSYNATATMHGVHNRPQNGYNPWSWLYWTFRDA